MNYLQEIDKRLAEVRQELLDLETTRKVILGLKPEENPVPLRKSYKTKLHSGALRKAKKLIPEILLNRPPTLSRDIISEIKSRGLVMSDSTVWKALKELKDDRMVQWNEENRLYSLAESFRKVAS